MDAESLKNLGWLLLWAGCSATNSNRRRGGISALPNRASINTQDIVMGIHERGFLILLVVFAAVIEPTGVVSENQIDQASFWCTTKTQALI